MLRLAGFRFSEQTEEYEDITRPDPLPLQMRLRRAALAEDQALLQQIFKERSHG